MVSNSFLTRKMHLNVIKDIRNSSTQHGVAVCEFLSLSDMVYKEKMVL